MFAEQLLRMIAGLLVGIWVARYLGPSQFGLFSYAIAFAALFGSIAKLGLDSIVVRDLVRDPNQRDLYLGTAFWLKLFGALAMLGIIGIAMQFTSSDTTTKIYVFIVASGAIFQSSEVVDFYFQSKVLSKFVSICKLAQLLTSSLLKLYLIVVRAELIWFVWVSLVDQTTLGISLLIAYRAQRIGRFFSHFDMVTARKMLRDSWPLLFSGLVVMVYLRIDQVMIKEMLGEKEVGLYSAAIRISEVWYFLPLILTKSLFPSIVTAKTKSENLFYSRLTKLYGFLLLMGVVIALPVTFLSDRLIVLLYGVAYKQAGQVLMIHIWSGIFVSVALVSGSRYLSDNLQRYAFFRAVFGAAINVALNLILIPIYGSVGAAASTVVAQAMMALLFDILIRRTRIVFK
ncbi:MAG: flippase [Burkholderiales bacterium]|nr:flippase [Burkholderiales bacterium]